MEQLQPRSGRKNLRLAFPRLKSPYLAAALENSLIFTVLLIASGAALYILAGVLARFL